MVFIILYYTYITVVYLRLAKKYNDWIAIVIQQDPGDFAMELNLGITTICIYS